MAGRVFSVLMFSVLLAMVIAEVSTRRQPKVTLPPNQCMFQQPRCGLCGKSINVTIIARNNLTQPNFEHRVTVTDPQRSLLFFLQKAADANGAFNFESTYYPTLGFFIDSFSGVRGSVENKTFWHIISLDASVGSLQCGASSFVPKNGDTILFNFTTWAQAGFDY